MSRLTILQLPPTWLACSPAEMGVQTTPSLMPPPPPAEAAPAIKAQPPASAPSPAAQTKRLSATFKQTKPTEPASPSSQEQHDKAQGAAAAAQQRGLRQGSSPSSAAGAASKARPPPQPVRRATRRSAAAHSEELGLGEPARQPAPSGAVGQDPASAGAKPVVSFSRKRRPEMSEADVQGRETAPQVPAPEAAPAPASAASLFDQLLEEEEEIARAVQARMARHRSRLMGDRRKQKQ